MKGRVKGLLGGGGAADQPVPPPFEPVPAPSYGGMPDPEAQRQALQVLTLAQRTADEHIASAQQQADKIKADARALAEQINRDAQGNADGLRRDAEKALADARAKAMQITKDAQTKATDLEKEAQRRYDEVVGSLESQRAALQEQIEALQEFDREYRSRLRKFMHGQLEVLGVDEPPARSGPPRQDAPSRNGPQRAPQPQP
jgi:DNA repair exonuclease SbcCD ATPase subunit